MTTLIKAQIQNALVALILIAFTMLVAACLNQEEPLSGTTISEPETEAETATDENTKGLPADDQIADEELTMEADQNDENQINQAQPEPSPQAKDPYTLFLSIEQVSINNYLNQYGQNSLAGDPVSAAAINIAAVTLNQVVFEENVLKAGDRLLAELTGRNSENAIIEAVTSSGSSQTLRGKISGKPGSSLTLSVTGAEALITLRLPEQNRLYLVKFNQQGGRHYLFEAPLDAIEKKAEEPLPEKTLLE